MPAEGALDKRTRVADVAEYVGGGYVLANVRSDEEHRFGEPGGVSG